MENKIEIRISAPEVVDAIMLLASAVERLGGGTSKELQRPNMASSLKTEEIFRESKPNSIKLDELRERISKLAQMGRQEQIRSILNKFGGKNLTEIPEEKYGELLKEVEKC